MNLVDWMVWCGTHQDSSKSVTICRPRNSILMMADIVPTTEPSLSKWNSILLQLTFITARSSMMITTATTSISSSIAQAGLKGVKWNSASGIQHQFAIKGWWKLLSLFDSECHHNNLNAGIVFDCHITIEIISSRPTMSQ